MTMLPKKALSKKEEEAKSSVWWDMDFFPVPCGYDAGRFRQCIERSLEKKLGYSGPVTISAYGDLRKTPEHVLRALSSTGIILNQCSRRASPLYDHLLIWKRGNPPPATIMVITSSGRANLMYDTKFFSGYNFFVDFSYELIEGARYSESSDNKQETTKRQFILAKCSESSSDCAPFYCFFCSFHDQSLESFTAHLSCEKHLRMDPVEMTDSGSDQEASLDLMEPPKKKRKTSKKKCTINPPETLVEANKVKKKLKKQKKKLMKKKKKKLMKLSNEHLQD